MSLLGKIDFKKGDGLVPVIVQDSSTLEVLMLGYMNEEAYLKTENEKRITFFSRSKSRLWTKGEESGNYLEVISIAADCDQDTLLILAKPAGPTCHTGARSCFNTEYGQNFLFRLEQIIDDRYANPLETSYVNKLKNKGLLKIAQKVGEEGVETVIAALAEDDAHFIDESSDLLFHLLVLLKEKKQSLSAVAANLRRRHESPELLH